MNYQERLTQYVGIMSDFCRDPGKYRIDPFRIFGPLYYVGDKKVCIHLIDSGDGLVLIDSGYPNANHLLFDSIWRLGFDPKDVRLIIHTHGHYDHFGASNEFRLQFGTELAMSRVDAEWMKKNPRFSLLEWAPSTPMAYDPPEFQVLIEDGQDLTVGNVTFHFELVPGHTPGVLAIFFDVKEGDQMLRAGLLGGVGLAAIHRYHLEEFGLPLSLPFDMLKKVRALKEKHVDIHLGNHPGNNQTVEKREKQLVSGGNPFISEKDWGIFLEDLEDRILDVIGEENFAE
jgi:metallo-beta-lactamase class B